MPAHRWGNARRDTPATQARRAKYATREHREARAAGERQMARDGWLPCWRCTRRIPNGTPWHVGHDDTHINLIRGYEHATCNLAAAGRKGNRVARARQAAPKPATRATRATRRRRLLDNDDDLNGDCVVCGATYMLSHADQKTCGRACGVIYRYGRGAICEVNYGDCARCHACFIKREHRRTYCSPACAQEANTELVRTAMRNRYRQRQGIPADAPLAAQGRPRK